MYTDTKGRTQEKLFCMSNGTFTSLDMSCPLSSCHFKNLRKRKCVDGFLKFLKVNNYCVQNIMKEVLNAQNIP